MKEKISLCYPEESRPGLILGQLNTFYERMKVGDLVLIPSESSKELYMGTLGNIITEVEHKESDDEYEKCRYSHKRTVEWIKAISPQIDVYLNRAIKSHQAVTEVTEYADILYRNIFPYYIEGSSIHLTFHKTTDSNFSLYDSIKLETAVMDIFQAVSKMYKLPDNKNSFKIKTAVGSPGFIEIIAENFNGGTIVALLIILLVFGTSVSRDEDGKISFSIGISNIIDAINRLINDRKNRQLTDAEIKKQTQKPIKL